MPSTRFSTLPACLLLAGLLAACRTPVAPQDAPPDVAAPFTAATFSDSLLVESTSEALFDSLRQRWEAARPARYQFTYTPICFCMERGPFQVDVENGVLTAITPASAPDYRHFTYDSLYARVADAYRRGAAQVRFQYSPEQGLLAGFYIDYEAQMADEEFGAQVSQFQPR